MIFETSEEQSDAIEFEKEILDSAIDSADFFSQIEKSEKYGNGYILLKGLNSGEIESFRKLGLLTFYEVEFDRTVNELKNKYIRSRDYNDPQILHSHVRAYVEYVLNYTKERLIVFLPNNSLLFEDNLGYTSRELDQVLRLMDNENFDRIIFVKGYVHLK